MCGQPAPFPLLVCGKEEITINNSDELTEIIFEFLAEYKDGDFDKKLNSVLWRLGIEDKTTTILDNRTMDLIQLYEFYKNSPHLVSDSALWFEVVLLLNKLQPRLF